MAATDLSADKSTILTHLTHITRRWNELSEPCLLEVVFLTAADKAEVKNVAHFTPHDAGLDFAADHIAGMNQHKLNAYATVNPVSATNRPPAGRRASKEHILASFFHFADGDDEGAAERIRNFAGPKCNFHVLTGTTPALRPHVYWELEEPTRNLDAWQTTQEQIAATLKTDPAVVDPPRIMRVAGAINWPKPKKIAKGYKPELVGLKFYDERPLVTSEQMSRAFAGNNSQPPVSSTGSFSIDTGPQSLDRDRARIKALSGQEWHREVIRLVGSYVARGLGDEEIHTLTMPLTLAGYTVEETREEVQTAIDGARRKGWTPDNAVIVLPGQNSEEESAEWRAGLIVNSRGRAIFNTANAMLVVQNDAKLRECFAFNEFKQAKVLTAPLPGTSTPRGNFAMRDIRDSDITSVVTHFNRNGFPDATKGVIGDVIDAVAQENVFHPVRNYLQDLPPWDGTRRVETWLSDYCKCEAADEAEEEYLREIGKRWLISAVARVMRPGCKADGVLILEGRQGALKSTTLRVLAGDEWFGDSLPNLQSKDAADYIRGKWVIEMAELSNMNKSEVEVVKAFISREQERFRPAYARNEITYPRQCVFAGSTNKSDYLRDETGNRRFWPARVGAFCDVVSLEKDRDQIWAETLHLYEQGEHWWLSDRAASTAHAQQESRVSQDAWEGDVVQYVNGMNEVSPTQIATAVLQLEVGRIDRAVTNRITAILTTNGFVRRGQFTHGANKGRARYVRT